MTILTEWREHMRIAFARPPERIIAYLAIAAGIIGVLLLGWRAA